MQQINLPTAERHSRLSNIITTLLRLALLGITSDDDEPREASVELLSAICTYLDFEGRPSVPGKGKVTNAECSSPTNINTAGFYASGHGGPFVVSVSEGLASHAPHLTMDFIAEVASSYPKMVTPMRANSLQYLGPWMKNLPLFVDPTSKFFEASGTRFRDCIRLLIDLTTSEGEVCDTIYVTLTILRHDVLLQLSAYVQRYIWSEVGKLETNTVNIILDELMRAAVDGGMGSIRCERVADTMYSINSINVRGRILARIRKV